MHAEGRVVQFVADVMTRAVVSAHADAPLKEIAAAMSRNHISTVPVLDERRRVIGVVSAADLLARISGDHGAPPRGHRLAQRRDTRRKSSALVARELMTAPAITVRDTDAIVHAARVAATYSVRTMPVLDGSGELVGMVSRSDLVCAFLREDDDIRDEVIGAVVRGSMSLDPAAVDVEVDEGVVTLHGSLETRQQIDRLTQRVRDVAGVVAVQNRMTFRGDEFLPASLPPTADRS